MIIKSEEIDICELSRQYGHITISQENGDFLTKDKSQSKKKQSIITLICFSGYTYINKSFTIIVFNLIIYSRLYISVHK